MRSSRIELAFPVGGISEASNYTQQPGTKPGAQSLPTSVSLKNVRAFDPQNGRSRGAQRCGISKYLSSQISGTNPIQLLTHMAVSSTTSASATANVNRDIIRLAICNGNVRTFDTSSTSTPTSASQLATNVPFIQSAFILNHLYFADGTNWKYYDAEDDTMKTLTASAGSLPINGSDTPRLMCAWRERLVVSGVKGDRANWFMSRAGCPDDFDYSPSPTDPSQAVAGNNSEVGRPTDIITALIPYSDNLLILGCDHSIWAMTGDPAYGGSIQNISNITGVAHSGKPWCVSPEGMLYFAGSRGGIYMMAPQSRPERITSFSIDERLATIDYSDTMVNLAWNDREQGVHAFYAPLDGSSSEHVFFDVRNRSFWIDSFETATNNPTAIHEFDGDTATDRAILLGGQDGYVRKWDIDAEDDDGDQIDSEVWIGPITYGPGRKVMLKELQATLGENTCEIEYEVYAGESAEYAATTAKAKFGGTWTAGLNRPRRARAQGQAIYIKVYNNRCLDHWSFERLAANIAYKGRESTRRVT